MMVLMEKRAVGTLSAGEILRTYGTPTRISAYFLPRFSPDGAALNPG